MTTNQILLRPAVTADCPAMRACIRSAYASYITSLPDLPDVDQGLEDDIKNCSVVIAQTPDGDVIGCAVLRLTDRAQLKNLAVSGAAQGLGIGRQLVDACVTLARDHGAATLHLTSHRAMVPTLAFYQRLGFYESDRIGARVMMAKQL
jgi:ribosomal protein S18 acetylase RimI-like enzyme